MITLYGFPISNYHNKVKLVLLEKGVPFSEHYTRPGGGEESVLAASPLGKVPFIRIADADDATLCESQVICEYLEARFPNPPLLPADPLAAAKVRELCTFVDLHLELVARELYTQAFFGGTVSESTRTRVHDRLVRHIAGFRRLARFSPYLAGDSYTLADVAAWVSLPLVGMATRAVLGHDLLADAGVDWKAHARLIEQRPAAQRVAADRREAQQAAAARARPAG
jgi:glutathione S-transferase